MLIAQAWDQRDHVVTIETTTGDLEIADPVEVAQYERGAEALTKVALTGSDAADRFLAIASELPRS